MTYINSPIIPKAIIVSTRVPVPEKPISGGMAPAVKASCVYFGESVWFGVGNGGDINRGGLGAEFKDSSAVVSHVQLYEKEGIEIRQITADGHEFDGHYNRFSNEFLWPACHDRPDITRVPAYSDLGANSVVNNRLAREITDYLKADNDSTTPVWIHDYHHMNLPSLLRANGVENPIIFFNHIPMPDKNTLAEIGEEGRSHFKSYVRELSHADVVLFQSGITADRFLEAMGQGPQDLAPYETADVAIEGRSFKIGNFPISINVPDIQKKAGLSGFKTQDAADLREKLVAENLFIDFARADYSKGFVERAHAFKQMMQERPDLRGKAQLVMGAEPSRTDIEAYVDYVAELKGLVEEINADENLWVDGQPPVVLLNKQIPHEDVVQLLRNDNTDQRKIGAITAWRDGMNLVCKEFVMAQDPENAGVLILSNGTGAAHEKGFAANAITYDPHQTDPANLIKAMITAIELPQESANRMAKGGQEYLNNYDLGRWAVNTVQMMSQLMGEEVLSPQIQAEQGNLTLSYQV